MSQTTQLEQAKQIPESKIELIKNTVAKGATDDELAIFLHQAEKSGLDPLAKQIHFVLRISKKTGKRNVAIQTGIDGYRTIADRTGCYAPGEENFEYEAHSKNYPVKASVSVKKFVQGTWHEFTCSAKWTEYAVYYGPNLGDMWAKFPETMLAKCAEAKALRKAFPAQLAGIYTHEEMQQADSEPGPKKAVKKPAQGNLVSQKAIPEQLKADLPDPSKILEPGHDIPTEEEQLKQAVIEELMRVCGTDGKLIEKVLIATTEWRKDGELKVEGVKTLNDLSFEVKKGRKSSRGEVCLNQLKKLDPKTIESQISEWEAGRGFE